ncbi:hypothetical protein O0L34_g17690 [Tuta absoluta]|nr:hypothetical protein O0L34_g17690 [Tuta absoluta]
MCVPGDRSSRRGAGGRTAALRRAPSDSDCSAETASLSADSADRVRPTLVPIRTTKNRSRRRGSEWEVLEGLKDGQRYDRRPEVFNGYLHKKRKWPLKGWHKRFFVVDGGILVYARSPADVARGRVHGSVDVGLSVISAKARRRRIDIDADEFIYHLRAKTPDVFRTWLNVLKTHRLYRQHLLTFGARDSAPKIHAPVDAPPTDTDANTLSSSFISSSSTSSSPKYSVTTLFRGAETASASPVQAFFHTLSYRTPVSDWTNKIHDTDRLLPLTFETLGDNNTVTDTGNRSLCSMNCIETIYKKEIIQMLKNRKPNSLRDSIAEQQILTTELENNSLKMDQHIESSSIYINYKSPASEKKEIPSTVVEDRPIKPVFPVFTDSEDRSIKPVFPVFSESDEVFAYERKEFQNKMFKKEQTLLPKSPPITAAYFLFNPKKRHLSPPVRMKKSKKSTNLIKYRNRIDEPPLDKPLMLLKKSRRRHSPGNESHNTRTTNNTNRVYDSIIGSIITARSSDKIITMDKTVQVPADDVPLGQSPLDTMTASKHNKITEQLIMSIFGTNKHKYHNTHDIKSCISRMVKELHAVKIDQSNAHPVKILFRCLLDYWLKNSPTENLKNYANDLKFELTPPNTLVDKKLSSIFAPNMTKGTQITSDSSDIYNAMNTAYYYKAALSKMKERQIQEMETLLNDTIYAYESVHSNHVKVKDHSKAPEKNIYPMSCELATPPKRIREFLELLNMLKDESGARTVTRDSKAQGKPICCDVETESVHRQVSVGVYTIVENKTYNNKDDCAKTEPQLVDTEQDSGQIYLKDVIDKVTTLFEKQFNTASSEQFDYTKDELTVDESLKDVKFLAKKEERSVVLDLTKYNLEHISIRSNSTLKDTVSITLQLKEQAPDSHENMHRNVNMIFSGKSSLVSPLKNENLLQSPDRTMKKRIRSKISPQISFKNPYIHYDPNTTPVKKNKSINSHSDETSQDFKSMNQSVNSHDLRFSECPADRQSRVSVVKKISNAKPRSKWRVASRNLSAKSLKIQNKRSGHIDEKFIFLLLENVTLLSRNVPKLHEDINVFFHNLKKKHETQNNSGLGLLGRIYNESDQHNNVDDEEVENGEEKHNDVKDNKEEKTSWRNNVKRTSFSEIPGPHSNIIDHLATKGTNQQGTSTAAEQINEIFTQEEKKSVNTVDVAVSSPDWSEEINKAADTIIFVARRSNVAQTMNEMKSKAVQAAETQSGPNWFKRMTRDFAMSTPLRNILGVQDSNCANFRFINDLDIRKAQVVHNRARSPPPLKSTFKPPNKVSREAKPDWKSVGIDLKSPIVSRRRNKSPNFVFNGKQKSLPNQYPNCDFNNIQKKLQDDTMSIDAAKTKYLMYPILIDARFHSGVSNVSSRELGSASDDIKTIYRRSSSVPSFVSG